MPYPGETRGAGALSQSGAALTMCKAPRTMALACWFLGLPGAPLLIPPARPCPPRTPRMPLQAPCPQLPWPQPRTLPLSALAHHITCPPGFILQTLLSSTRTGGEEREQERQHIRALRGLPQGPAPSERPPCQANLESGPGSMGIGQSQGASCCVPRPWTGPGSTEALTKHE